MRYLELHEEISAEVRKIMGPLAQWQAFGSRTCGNRVEMGPHVQVWTPIVDKPAKVNYAREQVANMIRRLYADVARVTAGRTWQQGTSVSVVWGFDVEVRT